MTQPLESSSSTPSDLDEAVLTLRVMAVRERNLRCALRRAADDLDKAANQFEGLYKGILRQFMEAGQIPGVNADRFAEKAKRAREAADA